jgi:hypothetical protein
VPQEPPQPSSPHWRSLQSGVQRGAVVWPQPSATLLGVPSAAQASVAPSTQAMFPQLMITPAKLH